MFAVFEVHTLPWCISYLAGAWRPVQPKSSPRPKSDVQSDVPPACLPNLFTRSFLEIKKRRRIFFESTDQDGWKGRFVSQPVPYPSVYLYHIYDMFPYITDKAKVFPNFAVLGKVRHLTVHMLSVCCGTRKAKRGRICFNIIYWNICYIIYHIMIDNITYLIQLSIKRGKQLF